MEAYAMKCVSGIISVSQAYIDDLRVRYNALHERPAILLPFGTSVKDFELVSRKNVLPKHLHHKDKIKVVYMGALTPFFLPIIKAFFTAFKNHVFNHNDYHFYFIGTLYNQSLSYKQLDTICTELDIQHLVTEIPQRVPYFEALANLIHADILFIPGSIDKDYNASKVYNNILSGTPIFSIFHKNSLVRQAILDCNAGVVVETDDEETEFSLVEKIKNSLPAFLNLHLNKSTIRHEGLKNFTAQSMAQQQIDFFNQVVG